MTAGRGLSLVPPSPCGRVEKFERNARIFRGGGLREAATNALTDVFEISAATPPQTACSGLTLPQGEGGALASANQVPQTTKTLRRKNNG